MYNLVFRDQVFKGDLNSQLYLNNKDILFSYHFQEHSDRCRDSEGAELKW